MGFLFSYIYKDKGKTFAHGGLLKYLTLLSMIYKNIIEKVALEKNMDIKAAQQFVDECLHEAFEIME